MCFGGGSSQPYPYPPNPDQTAYDKLQRDKQIQRELYIREGLDPDKPIVTQIDPGRGKDTLGNAAGTAVS